MFRENHVMFDDMAQEKRVVRVSPREMGLRGFKEEINSSIIC